MLFVHESVIGYDMWGKQGKKKGMTCFMFFDISYAMLIYVSPKDTLNFCFRQ